MKTKATRVMALTAYLLLAGCNKQSGIASESKPLVAEQPQPAVRVKVDLPIEGVVHLTIPPGTVAKMNSDMSDTFDPPIHPLGSIDSLSLYGKDIPLASKELSNGMLTTVGFGTFEVLLTGSGSPGGNLELRAFPADIEKLKKSYPAQGTQ